MRTVSIHFEHGMPDDQAWLLFPRPFDDGLQRCTELKASGIDNVREISALNSRQTAWLAKPSADIVPQIHYAFVDDSGVTPDWVWHLQDNCFTRPSAELEALASALAADEVCESDRVRRLVENASELFAYAHPEERFNTGREEIPTICGTAKGSCVDINTYLLAAARSQGIAVQYFAGYWFHPSKTETLDMHCWLAFQCDGQRVFWDLAHHLKWGVNELNPGLNPAGGRRVPMSCGRGLRFPTPHGDVEISHFSEPLWVLPGGETVKPELRIRLDESDEDRQ